MPRRPEPPRRFARPVGTPFIPNSYVRTETVLWLGMTLILAGYVFGKNR